MSWGISDKATEKEKIFAEFNDSVDGLNCVGKIDYDAYSQIYDFGRTLADREYEQGKADGVEEGKKQSIKHGHWIEVDFKRIDSDLVFLKCSNCFDVDVLYVRHMKYCPNCGARMDEEGEKNAENNTEFVPPDDSWDKVRNS